MTVTARGSTSDASVPPPPPPRRTGGAATIVATGILLSRVFGLGRQMLMAHFLGASLAGDAFTAAFKIPNILNNLFGEGVLSASFIPVYSRLLEDGREEDAGKLAGAVLGLLSLVVAVAVLVGVLITPWLIPLIAPGSTLRDARSRSRWCGFSFQAPGSSSSRRGASGFSTAIGSF